MSGGAGAGHHRLAEYVVVYDVAFASAFVALPANVAQALQDCDRLGDRPRTCCSAAAVEGCALSPADLGDEFGPAPHEPLLPPAGRSGRKVVGGQLEHQRSVKGAGEL